MTRLENARLKNLDKELDRDAVYYEKKIKPLLQLWLAHHEEPEEEDEEYKKHLSKYLARRGITTKDLGKGVYGSVISLKAKSWRYPVALKFQNCENAFELEQQNLKKMNRISLFLPSFGRIYDGYKLDRCIIVLPVAAGSLRSLQKHLLNAYLPSIICQGFAGIYLFHFYLYSHHCDTHLANWFYFSKKFKSIKILGYRIPKSNYSISLYDPGVTITIPDDNAENLLPTMSCKSPIYDYFRFISGSHGLSRLLPNHPLLLACDAYFNLYNQKYVGNGGNYVSTAPSRLRDWDIIFPRNVKSSDVFKDLMKIVTQNLSKDQVEKVFKIPRN